MSRIFAAAAFVFFAVNLFPARLSAYIHSSGRMDSAPAIGGATAGWKTWCHVPTLVSSLVFPLDVRPGNGSTNASAGVGRRHL
jgi:hypothetical protein